MGIRNLLRRVPNAIHTALDTPERRETKRIRLREALTKAHEEGFNEATRIWEARLHQVEEDLRDEYGMIVSQKDVQLEQNSRTMNMMGEQLADSRKAYRNYYNETIANKRLLSEVIHNVRRLFNSAGDIYKSFITIQDTADMHFKGMIKQDPLNRNLLAMGAAQNESDVMALAGATKKELKEVTEIDEEQFASELGDIDETFVKIMELSNKEEKTKEVENENSSIPKTNLDKTSSDC